jgi:hypothetical protein
MAAEQRCPDGDRRVGKNTRTTYDQLTLHSSIFEAAFGPIPVEVEAR